MHALCGAIPDGKGCALTTLMSVRLVSSSPLSCNGYSGLHISCGTSTHIHTALCQPTHVRLLGRREVLSVHKHAFGGHFESPHHSSDVPRRTAPLRRSSSDVLKAY